MRRTDKPLTYRGRTSVQAIRNRCQKNGVPCDLDTEWADRTYTGRCELTGISFKWSQIKGVCGPFSPSVDKIDPKLGYIQKNCRWVLHAVNSLKLNGTDEEMMYIARALVARCG